MRWTTKTSLQLFFENIHQMCLVVFCIAVASFFLLRGLTARVNVCSQSCTYIQENVTKNSAPQGKIRSLRLSIALKLGSKQKKITQGKTFIIDLFKTFLGLKTCEGFESPQHSWVLRPYSMDLYYYINNAILAVCVKHVNHVQIYVLCIFITKVKND